jgi:hypothetical protein
MTLLDFILIFALGWTMGEFYSVYHMKKTIKRMLMDEDNVRTEHIYHLVTEQLGDSILLYEQDTNAFICQGKSIEQLANDSQQYNKIKYATVKHGDIFFVFADGKVTDAVL